MFVTGESGTGKELAAEAIHSRSPRRGQPFVAINCGAIPGELMESEIFGHIRGAFTGAVANRDGAATRANGGTLFLDEICEMPLPLQTKLLRFIQTGRFQKVCGGEDESVDVRFVCATNRDPWQEVEAGRFREDLYYRLHVIPVHLPPLRDRGDDVIDIARQVLLRIAAEEGKAFRNFTDDALDLLRAGPWSGNVRELENVLRGAVVLHEGEEINAAMLPVRRGTAPYREAAEMEWPAVMPPPVKIEPLRVAERRLVEAALAEFDGNIPKAARALEISPSTLYRKLAAWDGGAG